MHELGVTDQVLKHALRHAEDAGAPRISDVYLVLGQSSTITNESVQFYWDMLSKGTPAEGARLHFREVVLEMTCTDCGGRFSPGEQVANCPQCGGPRVNVVAGHEFYLEAIDVES